MIEQTAKIIPLYPKDMPPIKCSFCGRELVRGKDKWFENDSGSVICIKPCATNAKKLIDADEQK